MSEAAILPAGRIRWPLAFTLALAAHLGAAALVALKPQAPAIPEPPPPPPLLLDLAPPPPPTPAPPPPRPLVQPPAPKPPPVIPQAAVKLPPPPPPKAAPASVAEAPPPPVASTAPADPDPVPALAPAPAATPPADALAAFQGRLLAHLGQHKRYPLAARQRRQQGIVWVRLTLDRGGRVLAHRLERGCGVDALDREAEELLERAQPLPAIPPELPQDRMELVLPVEFSLR